LSLADPAVEITATAKGERILACLGELHLEQSILDLQRVYCGEQIELRISEQIIEFGETTTWFENEVSDFDQFYNLQSPPLRQTLIPPYCYEDGLGSARNGRSRVVISNKTAAMHVRVIPLPKDVYDSLVQKSKSEKCDDDLILIAKALNIQMDNNDVDKIFAKLSSLLLSLDKKGNAMIQSSGMANGSCIKGVQTTRKHDEIYIPPSLTKHGDVENDEKDVDESEIHGQKEYNEIRQSICKNEGEEQELSNMDQGVRQLWSKLQGSCTAGFQAGCASGPLCEESVRGVLVILEGVEIAVRHRYKENSYHLPKPISGGMIVASLRTGIRCSLLTRPTRLVEGYLRLTLHSSLTGLGPLYAILSRRRGSVISDTMVDGTDLISIDARLPQSESFGLAPELLQKSSGEVTAPELIFSHWEVLDEDPFWIPTSLEEREDYGEIVLNGDSSTGVDNTALKYIRMVRDRKGLIVDSNKIIVAAEKQRTLARKK
jgi:ribosome assembly protein 1